VRDGFFVDYVCSHLIASPNFRPSRLVSHPMCVIHHDPLYIFVFDMHDTNMNTDAKTDFGMSRIREDQNREAKRIDRCPEPYNEGITYCLNFFTPKSDY
jgi:hypothetical protein